MQASRRTKRTKMRRTKKGRKQRRKNGMTYTPRWPWRLRRTSRKRNKMRR
jgi:hypothetical protein